MFIGYKVKYCGKVLKKTCDTQTKWYFIFSDHGCSCFLIKQISDLYNCMVFMMLSGLLMCFLHIGSCFFVTIH